jgi:hypothetical protein
MKLRSLFFQLVLILVVTLSGQAVGSSFQAPHSKDTSLELACHSHIMHTQNDSTCESLDTKDKSCCKLNCQCSQAGCSSSIAIIQPTIKTMPYHDQIKFNLYSSVSPQYFSNTLFRPPILS